MRLISRYWAMLGVVVSLSLGAVGALVLGGGDASAQCEDSLIAGLTGSPTCNDTSGGDARAVGGNGGNGGLLTTVHDVGNARADASNLVIVHDITTGDATASEVNVDARGATRPVVVSVAGSFVDTGVDVFAPGGNAQAGTTGGNNNVADSSGGAGGDARANGGDGGNANGRVTIPFG